MGGLKIAVIRRNIEEGAYGLRAAPHVLALLALIEAVEAADWYWRDPSPEAHENLTLALARFDLGDGA